jgi:hypothetical protein
LLHRSHPCPRQQRERDDGHFPEIDLIEFAHARSRIDLAAHGAIADRQTIDGALAHQRQQLAPARDIGDQTSPRPQPAKVLMQIEPDADRLGGIVLKQHRDFPQAALRQRLGERARHHHVARLVDFAEQAGVAFHIAVARE